MKNKTFYFFSSRWISSRWPPLIQTTYLLVIWDLVNIGQFNHINQMITLSVITLSGLLCTSQVWNKYLWLFILSHPLGFSQVFVTDLCHNQGCKVCWRDLWKCGLYLGFLGFNSNRDHESWGFKDSF
jgi:hypothetical protein